MGTLIEFFRKRVIYFKWFWHLGFLALLILIAVMTIQSVKNYQIIQRIKSLGGQISSEESDYHTEGFPSEYFQDTFRSNQFIQFESVTRINLYGTSTSDCDLTCLKEFKNLKQLVLSQTQISDVGLVHLKGFANLESLLLSNTQVSDSGLNQLKGLKNLGTLYVNNTQVTEAGVAQLKVALPDCFIDYSPGLES